MKIFIILIVLFHFNVFVTSKECINDISYLQSHTFRYELLSSQNETWKEEVFSHFHLNPTDDSTWSGLFPRRMLREEDEYSWGVLYRKLKNSNGVKGMLSEVSLHDVRLSPDSMHGQAQETNLEYLLMLDIDRLVYSFRKNAGLDAVGEAYGGWEAPSMQLRGHFVGQYMSATAQMWASTHNDTLKQKMTAVVSALSDCQEKIGTGYLSAFPSQFFDDLENLKYVWAPYYTMHKILAGLLDQYTLAGNEQAFKMMKWMVDYFYNRVQNVITKFSIERHWKIMNEETGGMNDVLYRLYSITGDQKHLTLAHLFDKPCFLGLLAVKADYIADFHANTHIPLVIGSQMRYEATGDPLYKEIGTFFMDIVNSSHAYATGGTSVGEFWKDPKRLADTLETENEESCTTYNMLKVARHLFRWSKEMSYADYYERALTNGVLSIQRGREPGVMIYMLPLAPNSSKSVSYHKWGTKFDSFWCCYGTGIESFSKLGDSIYFQDEGSVPSLYVIQYISSTLDWKLGHISLKQEVEPIVSHDQRLQATFTITSKEQGSGGESTLNLRIPLWTYSNGAKASLNGQNIPLTSPGTFLSIKRNWNIGDKITLDMPISIRTEAIKDDRPQYASLHAILYGPYLLAGLYNGEDDINTKSSTDWITPIPSDYNSQLISLSQESGDSAYVVSMNSNHILQMGGVPEDGKDTALDSSFRLVSKEGGPEFAIGNLVMLEPFKYPGMVVGHNGDGKNLEVSDSSKGGNYVFRLVEGLNGKNGTVSLEAEDQKGCFIYSGVGYKIGTILKLSCNSKASDEGFDEAVSFGLHKGFAEYHPISFVAKGMQRNFVLSPLLSLRDESYTVYFNLHS